MRAHTHTLGGKKEGGGGGTRGGYEIDSLGVIEQLSLRAVLREEEGSVERQTVPNRQASVRKQSFLFSR